MKHNYRIGVVLAFFIMISTPVFADFTENFEEYDDKYIDTSLLPLDSEDTQWNDWYAGEGIAETANEQGTTAILANDPDDANNKVLKLTRTKTGSSTVNLDIKRDIEIPDNERIEISFRMRKNGDQFGIKISDALELLRQDQFKFTNAASSIIIQQPVFKKNQWQAIKYTYNTDTMIACLYVDDKFVGSQKLSKDPDFKNIQMRINRDYRAGTIYFDDITVKSMKLPESIAFEDIANGQPWDSVWDDLDLKQSYGGFTYEWLSDNEAVITNSGVVTQDLFCQKQVKLTAKMYENNVWMKDIVFDLIVPSKGVAIVKETFDTQTPGIDISTSTTDGYGEWKLNADTYSVATSQGSSMKLIREGENGNKVLEIISKGAELLQPVITLENVINSGVVSANVRFKNLTPSFCISLAPFGSLYNNKFVVGTDLMGTEGEEVLFSEEELELFKNQEWNVASIVADLDNKELFLFINGVCVIKRTSLMVEQIEKLSVYSVKQANYTHIYVDNLEVNTVEMDDKERVETAKDFLEIRYLSDKKIDFYANGPFGTSVTWESKNTDVINPDGVIKAVEGVDTNVNVVATLVYGIETQNVDFNVFVEKYDPLNSAYKELTFDLILNGQDPNCVESDLNLISSLTVEDKTIQIGWEIDKPHVDDEGILNRPDYNTNVNLTATLTQIDTNRTMTKEFRVCIAGKGKVLLFENFEGKPGKDIATSGDIGHNGWSLEGDYDMAKAEGTLTTFKIDPENEKNVVASIYRETNGTRETNINLNIKKTHETATGLLSYSFRILSNSTVPNMRAPLTSNLKMDSIQFNDSAKTILTFPQSLADGKWHDINYTLNCSSLTLEFFVDGNKIGKTKLSDIPKNSNVMVLGLQRASRGEVLIDNFMVSQLDAYDKSIVSESFEQLSLNNGKPLTEDAYFQSSGLAGATITYATNQSEYIQIDGGFARVTRPKGADVQENVFVTITYGDYSETRQQSITISGMTDDEYNIKEFNFDIIGNGQSEKYVTEKLNLVEEYNGYWVTWTADNDAIDLETGNVSRDRLDILVNLTATFTKARSSTDKKFKVVIGTIGEELFYEDFQKIENEENTDITAYEGWFMDSTMDQPNVKGFIQKDFFDSKNFVEANKTLCIQRFVNQSNGTITHNQKIYAKTNSIKNDMVAYDFDFMLESNGTMLSFRIFNTDAVTNNKLFDITTGYIERRGYSETRINFSEVLQSGRWHHLTLITHNRDNSYDVYLNYEKLNDAPIKVNGLGGTINAIAFYSDFLKKNFNDCFFIDNVRIRDLSISDEIAVYEAATALEVTYDTTNDKFSVNLPERGINNTKITWATSDKNVIDTNGVVTLSQTDKSVTLTASISKGEIVTTKSFNLTIQGNETEAPTEDILYKVAEQLTFDKISNDKIYDVTSDLKLPQTVENGAASFIGGVDVVWNSDYPNVVKTDGSVYRQRYDVAVKLTARISPKGDNTKFVEKQFNLCVPMNTSLTREYGFEDVSENLIGDSVTEVAPLFENKPIVVNTEYGVQYYVDKNPIKSAWNSSENALYLDRYLISAYGLITQNNYCRISTADLPNPYELEFSMLSFRVLFTNNNTLIVKANDMLVGEIHISQQNITTKGDGKVYTFEEPITIGEWHNIRFIADSKAKCINVYIDDRKLLEEAIPAAGIKSYMTSCEFRIPTIMGTILVDDIRYEKFVDNSGENLKRDVENLSLETSYTNMISLKNAGDWGSRIIWNSSDESIVSSSGKILKSGNVTLTATLINGIHSEKKSFNVLAAVDNSDKEVVIDAKIQEGKLFVSITPNQNVSNSVLVIETQYKGSLVNVGISALGSLSTSTTKTEEIDLVDNTSLYGTCRIYLRDDTGQIISNQVKTTY